MTLTDGKTGVQAFGSVTGELIDTTLLFTMTIPKGGWPEPQDHCTAIAEGIALEVSNQVIRGTYEGENSCTGPFTSGSIRLQAEPLLPVDDADQIKDDLLEGSAME